MKMSTYLVAFVVGKLETTETVDVDGVPLRVVCTPGKLPLAEFALEVGAFALRFFTEYFNIPYPGDKVDLVAIPDFAAGAMENLGCITFRDTALLIDEDEAARAELERVADVIAHELAHMWFGDLVTMGWWEGIWLNEAFATFMETLCVDAFRPSWDRWVGFAPSREAALAVDALHLTRPIEYPVGPPKEAEGMFDVLTYEKGCGVLRMLEQHIGADVFRDGVRTYLKAHAYGNTVTSDLWDALEDASGAPVRDVMDTFILQGGHPLVSLHGDAAQPAALRARARSPPAPPRPSGRSGACPSRSGRSPPTASRARRCATSSSAPNPSRSPRPGAGSPWSTPAAGACSGSATRPRTGRRWPSSSPSSPRWSGPTCSPTRGRPPSPATRRSGSSWSWPRGSATEPDPAAWSPVGGALVLTKRIASAEQEDALARGGRRAHRPHPSPAGLRRHTGRERPHADVARARHQPDGHRGRRRRGPGGGGAALRRLAHRRRLGRSDPTRHRVGHAGRRVAARAARRLRRAAGALPDRLDAAGRDALPRCARRVPRRRPVPAHLRPGHDRGAQPERVRRPRLAPGQPRRQPGGVDPADRELGRRARPLPEERAHRASSSRSPPCAATPSSPSGPSHSSTPTRSRRARAGWPSRWSGSGSTWRSASRERAGLADSLRAAGAPAS